MTEVNSTLPTLFEPMQLLFVGSLYLEEHSVRQSKACWLEQQDKLSVTMTEVRKTKTTKQNNLSREGNKHGTAVTSCNFRSRFLCKDKTNPSQKHY